MTPREQFLADLATWILYAVVAVAVLRFARGFLRAVAEEVRYERRQSRRRAFVLATPERYCLLGHTHRTADEASLCEAAHGAGDL